MEIAYFAHNAVRVAIIRGIGDEAEQYDRHYKAINICMFSGIF